MRKSSQRDSTKLKDFARKLPKSGKACDDLLSFSIKIPISNQGDKYKILEPLCLPSYFVLLDLKISFVHQKI